MPAVAVTLPREFFPKEALQLLLIPPTETRLGSLRRDSRTAGNGRPTVIVLMRKCHSIRWREARRYLAQVLAGVIVERTAEDGSGHGLLLIVRPRRNGRRRLLSDSRDVAGALVHGKIVLICVELRGRRGVRYPRRNVAACAAGSGLGDCER